MWRVALFLAPSADERLANCESDKRYDLYHASLFEFSHVGYDRLSDESLDNDGEALVGKVSVYGTKFLALKVQAVDEDGNRISLSGSVSRVTSKDHSDYTSGSLV